jgi:tRNA1Val (adenine37-N6)-methyltransferase
MKTDYKQPDFYHFNEDSTKLVHFIQSQWRRIPRSVLDLGAGCGVIGIELVKLYPGINLTLVEGQSEFIFYLQENLELFGIKAEIHCSLFSSLSLNQKFDLIVSNPPYFLKGEGRVSPDARKQMCRTWERDDLQVLIEKALGHLDKNGEIWLSLRTGVKVLEVLKAYKAEIYPQSAELIYARVLA